MHFRMIGDNNSSRRTVFPILHSQTSTDTRWSILTNLFLLEILSFKRSKNILHLRRLSWRLHAGYQPQNQWVLPKSNEPAPVRWAANALMPD
jgi:hypothetical protein